MMTQLTAKTVEDVLRWVESTPHHMGAWNDAGSVLTLSGHHDRLRIPLAIHTRAKRLLQPGGHFDTRMFRATKAGRARLRRADPLATL